MNVRDSYAWKQARKRALRGATHCTICGGALDFDAPARSRWSPSVDHIRALALGGAPFDPSNLRVAHYGCNSSRGKGRGRRSGIAVPALQKRANWW